MDWNHDGKIDGHDMVHFHEVINSDSNNTPTSTGGGRGSSKGSNKKQTPTATPSFEISQLGKIVIGLTAFICFGFLCVGGTEGIGTLLGLGFVAFLVAQYLDG